jgi:hypothetical protein
MSTNAEVTNKLAVLGLLVQGKSQLRSRGHCQGRLIDEQGRVCAVGALTTSASAHAYDPLVRTASQELADVILTQTKRGREMKVPMPSLTFVADAIVENFNDDHRTRLSQVERVFDLAIANVQASI